MEIIIQEAYRKFLSSYKWFRKRIKKPWKNDLDKIFVRL